MAKTLRSKVDEVLIVDKTDLQYLSGLGVSPYSASTCDSMCGGGSSCGSSCGRCGSCSCACGCSCGCDCSDS